jgi:2-polyprenyl-6-methoxyphenol hydroxylase-like FAD-dependent oxidoreductase
MTSTAKHETDVLIVGAGPTGLTLACELLRRGVNCRIIDKAASPATTSRALGSSRAPWSSSTPWAS